jgi:hypothetical protein
MGTSSVFPSKHAGMFSEKGIFEVLRKAEIALPKVAITTFFFTRIVVALFLDRFQSIGTVHPTSL